jgi:hypothetical protein
LNVGVNGDVACKRMNDARDLTVAERADLSMNKKPTVPMDKARRASCVHAAGSASQISQRHAMGCQVGKHLGDPFLVGPGRSR